MNDAAIDNGVFLNESTSAGISAHGLVSEKTALEIVAQRNISPFVTWADVLSAVPSMTSEDVVRMQEAGIKLTSRTFANR